MHRFKLNMFLVLLLSSCFISVNAFSQDENRGSETSPPAKKDVLQDTDKPLDKRIQDPSKMTEHDLPSLPEQLSLPMPPDHRLAARAEDVPLDEARWIAAHKAMQEGLAYLRTKQHESGGWLTHIQQSPTDEPDAKSPIAVAVTALAVKCFAQSGATIETDAEYRHAVQYIVDAQNDDGSFEGGPLANYVTAATVSALASVDEQSLTDQLKLAVTWLQTSQWDQTEGVNPNKDWFGGSGYGNRGRPDLSNTQMMLDAIYDAGLSPDEPAFQRALAFLQRTQNLKQTNDAEWAGNDGGFVYTPSNGGESMASEAAGEGRHGELIPAGEPRSLRSYGSMTYAGFKSMLYAGLSPDDIRVRAAFDWIRKNFSFEENPGLGQQGLYYYYHTMARALRISQQDTITDSDGNQHNWRAELVDAILSRQLEDGSWTNEADRWNEGMPELVTIYCVLALQEALK